MVCSCSSIRLPVILVCIMWHSLYSCSVGIIRKINGHICIVGLGNLFGEKNLRLDMEKHEELRVVETELWDQFLHYVYVLTRIVNSNFFCNR